MIGENKLCEMDRWVLCCEDTRCIVLLWSTKAGVF